MPSVEFVEFVASTGDTTKRGLFRVRADNGPWMFSVVSGITRSAQIQLVAGLDVEPAQFDRAHVEYARREVVRRLEAEPGWAVESQGDPEVAMDLSTSDIDLGEFRRLLADG